MSDEYREYAQETAPGWLGGFWATAWSYVVGLVTDAWVEAAREAVKARVAASAPLDALPLLLRDMVLDDPYIETVAQTRARLAKAWSLWQKAGTKAAIVEALADAGYANVTVHERVDRWWDFTVTLRPPFAWDWAVQPWARWDAGWRYDEGYHWAGIAPAGERERVLAIIHKWKPTHARLRYVLVQISGPYWGEFTWGDGTAYGGSYEHWAP